MEYKSLGSLVKFVGGYSFKSEKYVPSGLRVIRIANVQDGVLEDNAPCYYPIEYEDMIADALLKEGDLLMSLTGNVGRVAFMTDEFLPAGLNQRVECFRTDDDIMKKYLFYMFRSKTFIQEALKNATGVAQLNMSTTWLKDYMVPIRGSNEMNSIIKTLDSIESAILSEKNAILSYDSLIKSRFNEMFGEVINENVRSCKFENICEGIIGLTYSPSDINDKGIIVLRSGNIQNNELQLESDVVRVNVKNLKKEKFIKDLDILMCSRNGSARLVGKTCLIHNPIEPMTWGAFMTVIRTKYPYILQNFIMTDYFKNQLTTTQTASVNQITNNMLRNYRAFIPTENEEIEFSKFVSQVDKLKFVNK